MDPTLLLRYSVEKINLPSGENMFRWLVRQSTVQQYFVYLFWLIKVKFFEKDSDPENESFLLRGLSVEYVKIMDLLASHGHGAEYEKDFAYQYLPYILSNAVYFSFFFLCPGSRHIYTKSFKKTILLQVVKVMHGLQLCTASVKVLWVRLFPEDNHDADDDVEDATEMFPVQIAICNDSKYTTKNLSRNTNDMNSHIGGGGVRVGSAIRNEVEIEEEDSFTRLESSDNGSVRRMFSSSPARINVPKPRRESMPDITYRGEVASERGEEYSVDETDRRQQRGRGLASIHTDAFANTSMSFRSKSQSRSKSPNRRIKVSAKTQEFVTKRKSLDSDTEQISNDSSLKVPERTSRAGSERGTEPGPSSLQNLRRNSTHLTDFKKSQSKRFLGSDTMPPSSSSSKLKGGSRFQAPAGVPTLSEILNLPPNPPTMKDRARMSNEDIGGANNTNGTLLSARMKGGTRTSLRGIPIIGMASTGTGHNSIKTLDAGPTDDTLATSLAFNVRPGTGTRSGTETRLGSATESGIGGALNPHEDEGNPLERTLLKCTSVKHGHKLTKLTRRQSTETINMKSVSPLMQEYFVSSVMAPVRTGIGAQLMHRTVPVSWCATGGADTHRKRVIFTDMHQDITDKGKEVDKEFLLASYLGKKNIVDNLKLINSSCAAVLRSDAATIGRFSLDLVKRQQQMRKSRGAGGRGEFVPELPIEAPCPDSLSVSDATLAANFDPADLDNFLANI